LAFSATDTLGIGVVVCFGGAIETGVVCLGAEGGVGLGPIVLKVDVLATVGAGSCLGGAGWKPENFTGVATGVGVATAVFFDGTGAGVEA
jgi:hypothetical protein